ncbi:hypothetical protein C1637_04920 [Chryseobacterium lactis]|uniref:DUF4369 domain-containing protein n=1 Tax=Chryseobacterium lactis TaxID=1241981 RepID=A0A3G6RPQ2_CHRLC|nr:hypothetical protein [Chryseobacterium lactis]AZA81917.1 hypothetical protein EG342_08310 [Chryseobacterium lactis]AZB06915.1 hypothetical protein EG341_24425 [Chryseobacterium lactis]PNW15767.1 hypothetical protein C1637_04920 [Chryseobacterium lactis]
MKKIIICILFTSSILTYAQFSLSNNGSGLLQGNAIFNKVNSSNGGKSLTYDEIAGTPYYGKGYNPAKFSGTEETALVRYNAFTDEVEVQKDDKTFVLPKNGTFNKITFTNSKEIIVKLDTGDDLSGYFFEIVDGKYGLYKKIRTKFIDAAPAANSYATDRPASFKSLDPVYYIKTPNGFVKNTKATKDIIKGLPERKNELETYFNANKTRLDKQEDLIKLINFLNSKS